MTFIRKKKVGDKVYLIEVKNVRENGKIKQKFVKYLGREVNGKSVKKVATSDIQAMNVKQSLDVLSIDKIAEELKLKEVPLHLEVIFLELQEFQYISSNLQVCLCFSFPIVVNKLEIKQVCVELLLILILQQFYQLIEHLNFVLHSLLEYHSLQLSLLLFHLLLCQDILQIFVLSYHSLLHFLLQ